MGAVLGYFAAPVRRPASVTRIGRAAIDALPPRLARALGAAPAPRTVALDSLDAELARAGELFTTSEDAAREFLAGVELAVPDGRPADPFSDAYREWTWTLYEAISRRRDYTVANEASPFDLETARTRPFPFQTGSASVVGDDLVARGHLLRCIGDPRLGLAPPARVIEFGPGWGNLTLDLAATGFEVTAVDVGEQFCTLLRARGAGSPRLHVVHEDMLSFTTDEPYDAAVFFESFHHCADHLEMLRRLHRVVHEAGVVFLAGEPVHAMPYPWGPRLDGLSLWSMRTYGWLELGFDRSYFDAALERTGWRGERRALKRRHAGSADVIVARADLA